MPASRNCPNCGTPAPDNFCPHCGQMQVERRITLRHVIRDFAEDQFGLTDRTPITFRALIFAPGLLSCEYFDGRIQRYISPIKLYLFASVLFFLLAGIFGFRDMTRQTSARISAGLAAAQRDALARGDSGRVNAVMGFSLPGGQKYLGLRLRRFPTDNWLRDAEVNFGFAPLNRSAERHLHELASLGDEQGTRQWLASLYQQIPKVLFVLLPVYALLLYAVYFRRRRYYVEHFIFSLHVHAFAFLVLVLTWIPLPFIRIAVAAWIVGYMLVAQKRFYQQSYLLVIAKSVLLGIAYVSIFSVGVLASLALALTTG